MGFATSPLAGEKLGTSFAYPLLRPMATLEGIAGVHPQYSGVETYPSKGEI
jgi:hypothetical protein